MIQGRRGPRFSLESFERLLILGEVFGKELERHHAAELCVLRLVHDAHAPATQFFKNAVVGNRLANHKKGGKGWRGYLRLRRRGESTHTVALGSALNWI